MKMCKTCKKSKELSEFHKNKRMLDGYLNICKDCCYENYSKRMRDSPKAVKEREWKRAGITITYEFFQELINNQNNKCAICSKEEVSICKTGVKRHLVVDHDHETGEIRGLLCRECNLGIGNFRDSPELLREAANYLEM